MADKRLANQSQLPVGDTLRVALVAELEGHTWEIVGMGFSADGRFLVTAANEDPVLIWDVATHTVIHRLAGHSAPVAHLALSPDGMLLAVALDNGAIWIWTMDGQFIEELPVVVGRERAMGVARVAFSPLGTPLAASDEQGTVRLWDLLPARLLDTIPCLPPEPGESLLAPIAPRSLAWAPDGACLARERLGRAQTLTRVGTESLHARPLAPLVTIVEAPAPIYDMAYSPDGQYLAIAHVNGDHHSIQLWNTASLSLARQVRGAADEIPIRVCFSSDGAYLALAGSTGYVGIWEVASGHLAVRFLAHAEYWSPAAQAYPINAVAWSPDRALLATAGWQLLPTYRTRHGGSSKKRHLPPGGPNFPVRLWAVTPRAPVE